MAAALMPPPLLGVVSFHCSAHIFSWVHVVKVVVMRSFRPR
jgi:hypothetical protein